MIETIEAYKGHRSTPPAKYIALARTPRTKLEMAAIFPKSSDLILKVAGAVIGLGAVAGGCRLRLLLLPDGDRHRLSAGATGAVQPQAARRTTGPGLLLLSLHRVQGGFRGGPVDADLHELPHQGEGYKPPAGTGAATASPTGQAIPWVQIHRLPDYVYFNHEAHISAGVSCVLCHGRIDQEIEVHQEKPLNMAFCLDCHRDPGAEPPAGRTGDQARLGPGPRSSRNRGGDYPRQAFESAVAIARGATDESRFP